MDELDLAMNWELGTGGLLFLAAAAVAVLLVMIMAFKMHAFLALMITSIGTALIAGIAPGSLMDALGFGCNSTLGNVMLLVALGAMLGRMIETSGGAQLLADRMIDMVGEKRAGLGLSLASLLMGFPIFFDAGLVVMLPIIYAVARRVGGSFLSIALPSAVAFSAMHIFAPPHPGPVAASTIVGADIGLVMLVGAAGWRVPWAAGWAGPPPRGSGCGWMSRSPRSSTAPPRRPASSPVPAWPRSWACCSCRWC